MVPRLVFDVVETMTWQWDRPPSDTPIYDEMVVWWVMNHPMTALPRPVAELPAGEEPLERGGTASPTASPSDEVPTQHQP